MNNSRTSNSIKNIVSSFINQGLVTLLTFVTRTVLVKELGAEYVGINGLFTNIISMLSLAELGIGMAIPFSLYRPIAEKNERKIQVLMKLYARVYTVIGVIVLMIGTSLTPFLQYFVKEMPDITNIRIIYLLFVFNSGISYFWAYKSLIITSDQKAYILTKINNYASLILAIAQCIVLIITQDFLLYLFCNIIATVGKNLFISYECNKRYPYLRKKIRDKLEESELDEIKKNVLAVCLYRIGTVLLNSTDGIIISKFINVIANGYYSNYTMITNALNSILSQISNGVVASIGNATVEESTEYNWRLFKRLDFANYWIYGIATMCLMALMNPFIDVWIGSQYRLEDITVWAISMNFYTLGMLGINSAFRNTYGLFWYGKMRPLVMSIINLGLDLILVTRMGVFGVVFATLVARILTTVWYDPYIVFKYGFEKSPKEYYRTYLCRFGIVNIVGIILMKAVKYIMVAHWLMWICCGIITFIIGNILFLGLYNKSDEFKFMIKKGKSIMKK